MLSRGLAAFLIAVGLPAAGAFAQTAPNPVQDSATIDQQGRPVFRVTVVGRTIPSVNYRPRSGDTELDMVGTALMPRARGEIEVSGKKGYIEITGEFDRIDPPTRFGPEYLTYVIWAITPEGRATNLGAIIGPQVARSRQITDPGGPQATSRALPAANRTRSPRGDVIGISTRYRPSSHSSRHRGLRTATQAQ